MDGTLDHTMIRVADLEESLEWYQTHLEYEEKDRFEGDGFTIVYLGPETMHEDGAMLEITHNEGEEPEVGDAWGHIAVRPGELEAYYQQLMDEGVEDYRDPESCGGRYAFVKDPDGHEIEIVQRDQGALWSLDHTMIRVEDADEALGFWTRKFEYDEVGRWEADTFANYFVEPEDAAPGRCPSNSRTTTTAAATRWATPGVTSVSASTTSRRTGISSWCGRPRTTAIPRAVTTCTRSRPTRTATRSNSSSATSRPTRCSPSDGILVLGSAAPSIDFHSPGLSIDSTVLQVLWTAVERTSRVALEPVTRPWRAASPAWEARGGREPPSSVRTRRAPRGMHSCCSDRRCSR